MLNELLNPELYFHHISINKLYVKNIIKARQIINWAFFKRLSCSEISNLLIKITLSKTVIKE